jgi:SAM-dependent methyltransferase
VNSSSVAPARLSDHVREAFARYVGGETAVRLNLGAANNHEPGFLNLDLDARTNPDVLHDLELPPLPFPEATFDCILGSHVFEHITNFLPLVADLYRILKPGGFLIAVTPHCGSDDAWDSPHHVRAFSENTWHYVCQALYERTTLEHAGFGAYQGATYRPWRVVQVGLVPYPDLALRGLGPNAIQSPAELEIKKRFMRNVIQEVHAVLQKAEA